MVVDKELGVMSFNMTTPSISFFIRRLLKPITVFLIIFTSILRPSLALAQNSVDTGSAQVSAFIPENQPPSTPILISPTNNSIITDNTPSFVWRESIDDRQISHYQLYLDGTLLFNNIPVNNVDNSQYSLIYDQITAQYSLTVKNNLSDGSHSWKIRAIDVLTSYADSVTWNFVIDTKAPYIHILNIEEKNTQESGWKNELNPHISSQDNSTIPSQPIEIDFNEPILAGIGEKNSTIVMIISVSGETDKSYEFKVNSEGKWQIQLGILPRGKVLRFNFTITDQAGYVSVLENVQLLIRMPALVFPPLEISPSLAPGILTPTPDPHAPQSTASGIINLPYLPPKEIIHEIIKEVEKIIPPQVAQLASAIPQQSRKIIVIGYQFLSPIFALLIALSIPLFSILFIASKFENPLSVPLLKKVAMAIGIFPRGKRQGIAIDDNTSAGIPFALVTINGANEHHYIKDSAITDQYGFYGGLKMPTGKYRLSFRDRDFLFPTNKDWRFTDIPHCLSQENYYFGQVFKIDEKNDPPLMIVPTTRINYQNQSHFADNLRIEVANLNKYPNLFLSILTGIIFIVCVSYPFISNWLVLGGYMLLWLKKIYIRINKKEIELVAIDAETKPIKNVVIKIENWPKQMESKVSKNRIKDIAITGDDGLAKINSSIDHKQSSVKITAINVMMDWLEGKDSGQTVLRQSLDNNSLVIVMKEKNS